MNSALPPLAFSAATCLISLFASGDCFWQSISLGSKKAKLKPYFLYEPKVRRQVTCLASCSSSLKPDVLLNTLNSQEIATQPRQGKDVDTDPI